MRILIILTFLIAFSACASNKKNRRRDRKNRHNLLVIKKVIKDLYDFEESTDEYKMFLNNINQTCVFKELRIEDTGDVSDIEIKLYDVNSKEYLKASMKFAFLSVNCEIDRIKSPYLFFNGVASRAKFRKQMTETSLCFQTQLIKLNETSPMLEGYERSLMKMSDYQCDEYARKNDIVSNRAKDLLDKKRKGEPCYKGYTRKIFLELLILENSRPSDAAIDEFKKEFFDFLGKNKLDCETSDEIRSAEVEETE
ncbi:hypothetical protein PVAND_006946 [Polypedilum vanderplanki]|uniref:Lipoprotein n=1 Tax=Polypedilum vanderplanki TaxID=319348 RepID=A0A9J6C5I1_POLVA|nr:hypothetical protein PVAND_006946 [Polypedilum vanderplanki]